MRTTTGREAHRWNWHRKALLRLRGELLRARDEHETATRAPHERGGSDPLDFTEDELELRVLRAELAQEEFELAEIDDALRRIDTGIYGICEETGEPIPAARLRAIPWTRLSKAAADRREHARAAGT
jgi:DnaK suppressor protein